MAGKIVYRLGTYIRICFPNYQDVDTFDDIQKDLYRHGMAAFGGISPTYHIELLDNGQTAEKPIFMPMGNWMRFQPVRNSYKFKQMEKAD